MLRKKTIIKKMIMAIEDDVLEGEVFEWANFIEMLLDFNAPKQMILEYIGEQD